MIAGFYINLSFFGNLFIILASLFIMNAFWGPPISLFLFDYSFLFYLGVDIVILSIGDISMPSLLVDMDWKVEILEEFLAV